jgi:hypothetical protein
MLDNKDLEIKVRQNMTYCNFVYKTTALELYMRLLPAIVPNTLIAQEFEAILMRMANITGLLTTMRVFLEQDEIVRQTDIQPYLDRLFDYSKAYEDMLALEDRVIIAYTLDKLLKL